MTNVKRVVQPHIDPSPVLEAASAPTIGIAAGASPVEDRILQTSHGRIAMRETAGGGTPLLFLHGNSSSKDVFERQLNSPLGQGRRCIAIDLPGHGASGDAFDPSRTYSVAGYADAAIEVLETLDIDQATLVGWSLGGHVALEMVASFPGVVGAMIVGAPPVRSGVRGLLSGFRLSAATPLLGARDMTEAQAVSLATTIVGADHAQSAVDDILRADGRARELMFRSLFRGGHADQRRTVETSDAVIAVVNGEDDPLVRPAAFTRPRYANLWGGACHRIPGGGHAPFLNVTPLFNHLLARFAQDMELRAKELRASPQLMYSG